MYGKAYIFAVWSNKEKPGTSCYIVDSAIHQINRYPVDGAMGFPNTYLRDDDLSDGLCYPTFEQPGPDVIVALPFYQIPIHV